MNECHLSSFTKCRDDVEIDAVKLNGLKTILFYIDTF